MDENLSPRVAQYLCRQLLIDAVAIRDRGLLGVDDAKVLEYAFNEDRILITANIGDFEKLATAREIHCGIVFILEGDLLYFEQLVIMRKAISTIKSEIDSGNDMINRILYISITGIPEFKNLPC